MHRLNYKHLYYFWMVVREGGVSRACAKLHLAQPTISSQLAAFEKALGEKLFTRAGRELVLTDAGRLVFHYAEQIFRLGQELRAALNGKLGQSLRLAVGITDAVPKLVAYRLMEPALRLESVSLICYDDKAERLLAELSLGELDLVLTDLPVTSGNAEVFNYLLEECPVGVFAASSLAARYRANFPRSLTGAPFILPTANTALRRSLDQWFEAMDIQPRCCAEVEDSALLKTFGGSGMGLFVAPSTVEAEVRRQYQVELVGRIEAVTERFYAITRRGRLKQPAIAAILAAREKHLPLYRDRS